MSEPVTIHDAFWTGPTGRAFRQFGPEVRDTAFYLLTGPDKNRYGLFTVEPEVIARHIGSKEKAVLVALDELRTLHFSDWHPATGWVWVYEMARYQFNAPLKSTDFRVQSAKKWYRTVLRNPFLGEWWDRYAVDFHLDTDPYPETRRESYPPRNGRGLEAPGDAPPPAPLEGLGSPVLGTVRTDLFGEVLVPVQEKDPQTVVLVPAARAEAFETLWREHLPLNGKQKKDALDVWMKLKVTPALVAQIMASHAEHRVSWDWTKEGAKYCPRLVNWLKKSGWLDTVRPGPNGGKPIVSERTSRNVAAAQGFASREGDEDEQ